MKRVVVNVDEPSGQKEPCPFWYQEDEYGNGKCSIEEERLECPVGPGAPDDCPLRHGAVTVTVKTDC